MEEADRLMKDTRTMKKWRQKLPKRSILGEIDNLIHENLPTKTKTSKPLPEVELPPPKKLKQDFFAKREPTSVESGSDKNEPKPVAAQKAPVEKPKKVTGKKPIPVIKGQMRITAFMRV